MNHTKKKSVSLLFVCILSVLFLIACGASSAPGNAGTNPESVQASSAAEPASESLSGKPLIGAFTTSDLDGNTVTESILKEKEYTMINVWGTYCGPCINEMPELEEIHQSLPENIQMIGMICDLPFGYENDAVKETAYEIIEETGVTYPSILFWEEADWFYNTSDVVPTTYFVDSEGNLASDIIYGADVDAYKAAIEKLGK